MTKLHTNHLALSWSTSKGRDTYGYNICRLDSHDSGKRYRCSGGGYDMVGTVVADWLVAEHQDKLVKLAHRAHYFWDSATRSRGHVGDSDALYGMTAHYNAGELVRVTVDGACGIECVIRIAEACGIELQRLANRRGHTVGFIASWEA